MIKFLTPTNLACCFFPLAETEFTQVKYDDESQDEDAIQYYDNKGFKWKHKIPFPFIIIGTVTKDNISFDTEPYVGEKDPNTGLFKEVNSEHTLDMWVNSEGKLSGLTRVNLVQKDSAFYSLLFSHEIFVKNPMVVEPVKENYFFIQDHFDNPEKPTENFKKDWNYWDYCEKRIVQAKLLIMKKLQE